METKETGEEMGFLNDNQPDKSRDPEVTEIEAEIDRKGDERGHWGNKVEFFLAIMGYTVGVGSVWRFPIICSRNGGGAFLIPFFFFLLTYGIPLNYLEVCLGQFSGKSAGLAFEFCPLLQGIGFLQVSMCLTVVWYCVMISAWTYYYLYSSFFSTLPWTTCTNSWNTPRCIEYGANVDNTSSLYNTSVSSSNVSLLLINNDEYRSPAFEFWEHNVIGRSTGMSDIGGIQLHLAICMALAWIFTSLAVTKGAVTLGKVVYVTATAPYLFLTIIFIRGLTLEGASDGIVAFLKPDFGKMFTIQTWLEAAIQVFYSLGPTWGGVITMASYNRFHQKSFWSSTMCVVTSGFTSFYNGLIVFTILGFMAKSSGLPVEAVAKQSGPGLAFIAFPVALSKMPLPHLWSVLFFLMLVTVTFDSLFGMFETVTSGLIDFFPRYLTSRRIYVNIGVTVFFILSGLPLCLNNGIYVFQLSDWYFSSFGLLVGSLLECVAVCWFYGTDRFSKDIALMTGRNVSPLLRIMLMIFIPLTVFITFITMLSKYSTPAYGDGYVYSSGWIAFGIIIGLVPVIGLIAVGVVTLLKAEGTLMERLRQCSKPSKYWGPSEMDARRKYQMKPYSYPPTLKRRLLLDIKGSTDDPVI